MKVIDGQIRKIKEKSSSKVFFDFEFWSESDADTYGLLCLIQRGVPANMFITEMNANELAISDGEQGLDAVKDRVSKETGIDDLVFPKIIRFNAKTNEVKAGFQAFLKAYEAPVAVYQSIFNRAEEAIQVEKLSIAKFKELGGQIHLLGKLSFGR